MLFMMKKEKELQLQRNTAAQHRDSRVSGRTRHIEWCEHEQRRIRAKRRLVMDSDGRGLHVGARATVVGMMGEHAHVNGEQVVLSAYDEHSGGWTVRNGAGEER